MTSATVPTVTEPADLTAEVRALRAAGRSPKQIARILGVPRSSVVSVAQTIVDEAAAAPGPELPVVGCWVSPGWSAGLGMNGPDEWRESIPPDDAASGLAAVAVALRYRPGRVSVCGYLVDVHCLGVKDALGPKIMSDAHLPRFLDSFFGGFDGRPLEASLELARHLVWGAVDYARGLGFAPAPDFEAAAGHLGPWQDSSMLGFGRDGMPYYVQGPYDDARPVLDTLRRSVGDGNFHFIVSADLTDVVGW